MTGSLPRGRKGMSFALVYSWGLQSLHSTMSIVVNAQEVLLDSNGVSNLLQVEGTGVDDDCSTSAHQWLFYRPLSKGRQITQVKVARLAVKLQLATMSVRKTVGNPSGVRGGGAKSTLACYYQQASFFSALHFFLRAAAEHTILQSAEIFKGVRPIAKKWHFLQIRCSHPPFRLGKVGFTKISQTVELSLTQQMTQADLFLGRGCG